MDDVLKDTMFKLFGFHTDKFHEMAGPHQPAQEDDKIHHSTSYDTNR
jgi:hypothetical protein